MSGKRCQYPDCDCREKGRRYTYKDGMYGPYTVRVCAAHLAPMIGRVYPNQLTAAK